MALIRLLRNKWSCLVSPEFRIPRFFWWDLLNCLWWEKLRENWLSNRNNISRERTKSFWGDDLAPWRYPPKPTPKKRESRDDPDHHNELVPGEVSPHSSSTPFFLLRPLDVLSFIDVQQVFLLLEFSLGVNHKKKLWRKKSNKIRQSTCGQTPLYMDIGSGFFIFEEKRGDEV